MKISELQPRQGKVEVRGTIVEVSEPREFQKYGRAGRVASSLLRDDSGEVVLTLWDKDVERFKPGDQVKIVNGYVNEWQGELQLTGGRYGSVERVDDAS